MQHFVVFWGVLEGEMVLHATLLGVLSGGTVLCCTPCHFLGGKVGAGSVARYGLWLGLGLGPGGVRLGLALGGGTVVRVRAGAGGSAARVSASGEALWLRLGPGLGGVWQGLALGGRRYG